MMIAELLIHDLIEDYGYEAPLTYAENYIEAVAAEFAEVEGSHPWLQGLLEVD